MKGDTEEHQGDTGEVLRTRDLAQDDQAERITGEDCFLVKVHAPAIEDLEVFSTASSLHGQTITSIVVASPLPPRALPVDRR